MTSTDSTARPDVLPPIGEAAPGSADEGRIVELIFARRQGIINVLSLPLRLAKTCRKYVAWGEDVDTPDETYTVVHKIRQAVETQVSNHLKEPVKATIDPVETGEYAKFYWAGPPEAAMDMQMLGIVIDPVYMGAVSPMGQFYPPQPLPANLVMQLKQMSQQYPDIVNPDYVCKLDDQYTAKTLQRKLDADWKTAKTDKWLRSRVYANVVEGWQLPFIEYSPEMGIILNRNSIFQTYIDQSVEDIDEAVEAGIDLYQDLDEALAKYPDQAEAILKDDVITQGTLYPIQTQGQLPTQYQGNFRRPMVRKLVWWMRNQPINVPMGEQEAIDGGHVQINPQGFDIGGRDGLDSEAPVQPTPITGDVLQQRAPATEVGDPETNAGQGNGGTADGDMAADQAPQSGLPIGQAEQGMQDPAYSLPDGMPVHPDHPQWPTKRQTRLRQISIINNSVVEDIVCPWPDIPILHMRNTLIIGKPWGIGEPFYVKKLQDAYSNITDAAVKHVDYNANPAMEMHQGLKNAAEAEYGNAFVTPNKIIGIPPEYWIDGKPLIRPILPPPFPESSIEIRNMLGEDFNEIAGRPDVTAGNTPTPDASGKMVALLQNAAAEPLNFKAQEITFAVEKLVELWLHAIVHFEDPAKIAEQLSMPLPLLMLILERAGRRPPNVQAMVSTGAGSVLERKRSQYLQWNQTTSPDDGMPLADGATTRGVLGLDPTAGPRRSLEAAKQTAMAMPQPSQPGQNGKQYSNGENGQASSNGNGRMHE